jgi:hypothetical protein
MRHLRNGLAVLVLLALALVTGATPAAAATWVAVQNGHPSASGKCLDHRTSDFRIQMYTCNSTYNQQWDFEATGTHSVFRIRLRNGGKCLDGWNGRGQQLVALGCDGSTAQLWLARSIAPYHYWESRRFPGQCIDFHNYGSTNIVQLWDCNNTSPQLWRRV